MSEIKGLDYKDLQVGERYSFIAPLDDAKVHVVGRILSKFKTKYRHSNNKCSSTLNIEVALEGRVDPWQYLTIDWIDTDSLMHHYTIVRYVA